MNGFPRRYIILDTETHEDRVSAVPDIRELSLRLGVALVIDPDNPGGRSGLVKEFDTIDGFLSLILTMPAGKSPIYVFAHNMGFDSRIAGVWKLLSRRAKSLLPHPGSADERKYRKPLFIVDDFLFIMRTFRQDGQVFIWLDTVQWFRTSLAKVGMMTGVRKLSMPDPGDDDRAWYDYCRGDVHALHAALKRLWCDLTKLDLRSFESTPAEWSRRHYRVMFESGRIVIPTDPADLVLDRLGYYGGYSDLYRAGPIDGPIYQIDINSLYPHVMGQNLYPCEVEARGDASGSDTLPADWDPPRTTAEVWLESPDRGYPVKFRDQNAWCAGRVRTVLCGPELAEAWRSGHVAHVGRWTQYRMADLFGDWARYWGAARAGAMARGDKFALHIIKIIMNCLHGKFGQQTGEWVHVGKGGIKGDYNSGARYVEETDTKVDTRVLDGQLWERRVEVEDDRAFVPIAAWTASYARMYMDWMMDLAGRENCYYIATDSLLVNDAGFSGISGAGIMDTSLMGHFKTELVADRVTLWNVNQLDLEVSEQWVQEKQRSDATWVGPAPGTLKRRSGVRRGSTEISPGIWSIESWESAARGVFYREQETVLVERILMQPLLSYSRRQVLPGGITSPWSIDCWSESPEATAKGRLSSRLKRGK
jgi:hypothetical protein